LNLARGAETPYKKNLAVPEKENEGVPKKLLFILNSPSRSKMGRRGNSKEPIATRKEGPSVWKKKKSIKIK